MKYSEYAAIAPLHVIDYMKAGKDAIDELFGDGYAAANPELLSAFIAGCNADILANIVQDDVGGHLGVLSINAGFIAEAIHALDFSGGSVSAGAYTHP